MAPRLWILNFYCRADPTNTFTGFHNYRCNLIVVADSEKKARSLFKNRGTSSENAMMFNEIPLSKLTFEMNTYSTEDETASYRNYEDLVDQVPLQSFPIGTIICNSVMKE